MATPPNTDLERELSELLEQERFEPPAAFAAAALVSDRSLHERAAADPDAWWAGLARDLDWFVEPTEVLDDSNPPFYRWFADGRLNASVNCLDRHVEAGSGDRVAFHWHGEEGEQRDDHLRRPSPRRPAARQRPDRARGEGGRRGRDLPADDPRGGGGDACLRANRSPPQRRLRRLLAGGGQGADAVLRREGADHRRRRPPQGQGRRDQAGGGRVPRPDADDRDRGRRPQHRRRGGDARGSRRLLRRGDRGRRPGLPTGRARRRAPPLHPLLLGFDGEAEGDPAHHRRLSDRRRLDPAPRLRPEARIRRLLVLRRRRLGHRALLHRLRTAALRCDLGHVRGGTRLPRPRRLVGSCAGATG